MKIPAKPGENRITNIEINYEVLTYKITYKFQHDGQWIWTALPNSALSLEGLFAKFVIDMRLICGTLYENRFDSIPPMWTHD